MAKKSTGLDQGPGEETGLHKDSSDSQLSGFQVGAAEMSNQDAEQQLCYTEPNPIVKPNPNLT